MARRSGQSPVGGSCVGDTFVLDIGLPVSLGDGISGEWKTRAGLQPPALLLDLSLWCGTCRGVVGWGKVCVCVVCAWYGVHVRVCVFVRASYVPQ